MIEICRDYIKDWRELRKRKKRMNKRKVFGMMKRKLKIRVRLLELRVQEIRYISIIDRIVKIRG